jgi:hypothetical protein
MHPRCYNVNVSVWSDLFVVYVTALSLALIVLV